MNYNQIYLYVKSLLESNIIEPKHLHIKKNLIYKDKDDVNLKSFDSMDKKALKKIRYFGKSKVGENNEY